MVNIDIKGTKADFNRRRAASWQNNAFFRRMFGGEFVIRIDRFGFKNKFSACVSVPKTMGKGSTGNNIKSLSWCMLREKVKIWFVDRGDVDSGCGNIAELGKDVKSVILGNLVGGSKGKDEVDTLGRKAFLEISSIQSNNVRVDLGEIWVNIYHIYLLRLDMVLNKLLVEVGCAASEIKDTMIIE